jgi:hypothetical protein
VVNIVLRIGKGRGEGLFGAQLEGDGGQNPGRRIGMRIHGPNEIGEPRTCRRK